MSCQILSQVLRVSLGIQLNPKCIHRSIENHLTKWESSGQRGMRKTLSCRPSDCQALLTSHLPQLFAPQNISFETMWSADWQKHVHLSILMKWTDWPTNPSGDMVHKPILLVLSLPRTRWQCRQTIHASLHQKRHKAVPDVKNIHRWTVDMKSTPIWHADMHEKGLYMLIQSRSRLCNGFGVQDVSLDLLVFLVASLPTTKKHLHSSKWHMSHAANKKPRQVTSYLRRDQAVRTRWWNDISHTMHPTTGPFSCLAHSNGGCLQQAVVAGLATLPKRMLLRFLRNPQINKVSTSTNL